MKFRAVITDSVNIKEFLNIIGTFSRMEKNLIINVQPHKLILQIETEACDGQYLWCEIDTTLQDGFFPEYIMDGIDAEHNQIYMICLASSLLRALSYVRNNSVDYVKLKLIKTHMPCLSVEMSATITNQQDVVLTPKIQHAIPITVVPRNEWNQYEIPSEVDYDLSIVMPSAKSLRMILDKKKNLAPTVTLYATLNDELSLVVETDVVTVASHYRNLKCVSGRRGGLSGMDGPATNISEASCRVDTKKLASLFETIHLYDVEMTANVRHEQALNIRFDMRKIAFVNYILPATILE